MIEKKSFLNIFKIQNLIFKKEFENIKIDIEKRFIILEEENKIIKDFIKSISFLITENIFNNFHLIKITKNDLNILINDYYQKENIIKYLILKTNKNINIFILEKILIFLNYSEIIQRVKKRL